MAPTPARQRGTAAPAASALLDVPTPSIPVRWQRATMENVTGPLPLLPVLSSHHYLPALAASAPACGDTPDATQQAQCVLADGRSLVQGAHLTVSQLAVDRKGRGVVGLYGQGNEIAVLKKGAGHGAAGDSGQASATVAGVSEHVAYHRHALRGCVDMCTRYANQPVFYDDPVVYSVINVAGSVGGLAPLRGGEPVDTSDVSPKQARRFALHRTERLPGDRHAHHELFAGEEEVTFHRVKMLRPEAGEGKPRAGMQAEYGIERGRIADGKHGVPKTSPGVKDEGAAGGAAQTGARRAACGPPLAAREQTG